MKTAIALIPLLPLLGGICNILFGRRLSRRLAEFLACAVIWGSFVAAVIATGLYAAPKVVTIGPWLSSFAFKAPISFLVDPLSLTLCLMITFVCGLIHLYSVGYMEEDASYVRYFALLNLFTGAMLILVLASNLLLLYLGWEGVGFCSYALIGFWYKEEKNATAGRKAFIVTRIGDIGFGIAIVWMFKLFGTISIPQLNHMGHLVPMGVITGIGLLLLLGAMGKSAQAPLMVWLPDAMAGPTPVSAQIHAATMVTAGVYLLMRMFPLVGVSAVVGGAIALTGTFTAFYGASCAIVERDIKRILAYSTISQIGYMMMAVGCGAISAATFHLIIHAFFKSLLFLGAGCIITAMHHEQDIFRMGGLRRRMPVVFWTFLAASLCLAGVPPTGGFFSKDGIMGEVWAKGGAFYGFLYLVGMITVFLTVIYTFRMLFLVFGDREAPAAGDKPVALKKLPVIMTLTCIPLALLAFFGGLFDVPGYLGHGLLGSFLAPLNVAKELNPSTELLLQVVAAAVVLVAIGVAWWAYGSRRRALVIARAELPTKGLTAFLQAGWYFDAVYAFIFVRPFKRLSHVFWQGVDEGVIDDSLDRMASGFGRGGQLLGRWGGGRVSLYILSLVCGAALMIIWFTWGRL